MPEGDTILRTARTLHRALAGGVVRRLRTPLPAIQARCIDIPGRQVEAVEARGKNLLLRFDDGRVLYTHMRMSGAWHVYRPGERWRKPERRARVVLETDAAVAVCFSAPVVELLTPLQARHHPALEPLGPDLLAEAPDREEAVRRLRTLGERPVGEALLVQRCLAGIGNVYKSETLFLCRLHPSTPVTALGDAELRRLLDTARDLMRRNLNGAPRRTRAGPGGRYWVYGRRGKPCRRCGTQVRLCRQGDAARATYFCPACQPGAGGATGTA